ncbi:MAG TPA: sigma-70 family RNA polymerase sigma factor [Kofleriaceae bacterium]|nr:sigma-70 family RNA polymerase sigma factor [Kofleriaceae bacterium]
MLRSLDGNPGHDDPIHADDVAAAAPRPPGRPAPAPAANRSTHAPASPTRPRAGEAPRLDARTRAYARAIALRMVKDEHAADDVAQDAMLLAHRHRDSFRGQARFSTWLYRVTTTAALMYLRRQRRWSREVTPHVADEEAASWIETRPDPAPATDASLAAHEQCAQVRGAVDRMGPRYRDVFRLRFVDGYTETEIADRLDLSVATVKTRAHRARLAARAALAA